MKNKHFYRKQRRANMGEQMFKGQVERESLDAEPWLFGQQPQLQVNLELFIDEQQERRDFWELPKENSPKPGLTKSHFHNSKSS